MSITCKKCGAVNPDDSAVICPNCGVVYAKAGSDGMPSATQGIGGAVLPKIDRAPVDRSSSHSFTLLNLLMSVFGAALLAIGAFMPVLSFGVMKISYFKDGHGDGLYVLIMAGLILLGALFRSRRIVGYLSMACLTLISFGLFMASHRITEVQDKIAHDVQGNPFAGVALAVSNSISLEWGWGVMYTGGVMALLGAMLSEQWLKKYYGG